MRIDERGRIHPLGAEVQPYGGEPPLLPSEPYNIKDIQPWKTILLLADYIPDFIHIRIMQIFEYLLKWVLIFLGCGWLNIPGSSSGTSGSSSYRESEYESRNLG
ncbi:MAG TPA: hypothetical protein VKU79_00155 [Thermoplasmataceae archaeon]|nr:hypothetical protein [Thermoplasmataceae archaeon]